MQFDIITIFPDFFTGPLDYGIVRRAREAQLMNVRVHDLRDYAHDRHRTVDDRPFGGGEGMVLKPEPLFEAVESLLGQTDHPGGLSEHGRVDEDPELVRARFTENVLRERHAVPLQNATVPDSNRRLDTHPATIAAQNTAVVLLSASGKLFRQDTARRFAQLGRIILICGRYEGVDERVAEHLATNELSIGDYVLSGGELGAALIVDTVTRLLPGALGNEDSSINESFSAVDANAISAVQSTNQESPFVPTQGKRFTNHLLLDFPHYTRPAEFRGWPVPEILLGGNHEEIRRWRRDQALEKTKRNRPDLLGE